MVVKIKTFVEQDIFLQLLKIIKTASISFSISYFFSFLQD